MNNAAAGQLESLNEKLASVITCECGENGCKVCALKIEIKLPEVDIEDCDGNVETVEALPVAPVGVQKVEICNATPDVESVTYCNKDTDTQWLRREIVTFDTDGVPTVSVLSEIDLGVPCTDPQPDIEEIKLCINGTQQIQFYRFITSEDQSTTTRELIDTIDTGIACNETRNVDVLTSCDGTTKTVEVKDSVATQVVLDSEQVVKVAIDKTCDTAPTSRDVDIKTDCAGTTETIPVKDEFATEVVLSPNQNLSVTIDKSCDAIVTSDIVTNCAGDTSTETVDSKVSIVGSENPIEVRIKESCITDTVKTVTTKIDCAGTTADIDTTKTVEAVINQVVDTKQCNKEEGISEIEVCVGTDTLIKKTVIDSEGTEVISFYGEDGVVATPTAYTIGACVVKIPGVDISFVEGCSSIDGRMLVNRISTDTETNIDTITLLESDLATLVTDGSTLVKCSGADYELVSEVCMENTTTEERFRVSTYVNPTDSTDNYKVWVDANGDIVTEPTGVTPCVSDCNVDMHYERCFDTGAGIVTVAGYFEKDSNYLETYKSARVISSTDPALNSGDDVLSESWLVPANETTCSSGGCEDEDLSLALQSGNGNIPAGLKSVTINNITGITTINGGYELGNGRRDNSISFGTNRGNCVNEILPAYTLAGGTWQWVGHA